MGRAILHVVNEAEKLAHFLKMEPGDLRNIIRSAPTSLFARRASRTVPFLDEKVITSWNGLMISAMAKGFQISGRGEFLIAAQQAAEFILSEMMSGDRLFHVYKDGRARLIGLQDDYSSFVVGLLDLFEADFNNRWLESAARINQAMDERFWDEQKADSFTRKQEN